MYKRAFFQTLVLAASLFLIHLGIALILNQPSLLQLGFIHGVLSVLTFGGLALLLAIHNFDENKLGFAFLAVSTIKLLIAASIVLVLVKIMNKPKSIAIHFAGMYFPYVLFLAFQTFKLLNKKKENDNKQP